MSNDAENEQLTEEDLKGIDETQDAFEEAYFGAIGKAITSWSRMEGGLVVIAAMLLDTTFDKAGLVFYSIPTIHTWLSIIDELFSSDTRYQILRSEWTAVAARLKKLNDTRVRLAHHSIAPGKRFTEALALGEASLEAMLPTLQPNRFDTRNKSKKLRPLGLEQIVDFVESVATVTEMQSALAQKMCPIFLEPKRKIIEGVRKLREKADQQQARKDS